MGNSFCFDLLYIYRMIIANSKSEELNSFIDAVAKYFIVQAGYAVDQVDQTSDIYLDQINRGQLEEPSIVFPRIMSLIGDDDWQKMFIISSAVAIIELQDKNVKSDAQRDIIQTLSNMFDMRPSDFDRAVRRGVDLVIAIKIMLKTYIENQELLYFGGTFLDSGDVDHATDELPF